MEELNQELQKDVKELKASVTSIDKHFAIALQKIDDYFAVNGKEHKDMSAKIDKTNGRVRRLELWRSYIIGGITVIVFVMGWVMTIVF